MLDASIDGQFVIFWFSFSTRTRAVEVAVTGNISVLKSMKKYILLMMETWAPECLLWSSYLTDKSIKLGMITKLTKITINGEKYVVIIY